MAEHPLLLHVFFGVVDAAALSGGASQATSLLHKTEHHLPHLYIGLIAKTSTSLYFTVV